MTQQHHQSQFKFFWDTREPLWVCVTRAKTSTYWGTRTAIQQHCSFKRIVYQRMMNLLLFSTVAKVDRTRRLLDHKFMNDRKGLVLKIHHPARFCTSFCRLPGSGVQSANNQKADQRRLSNRQGGQGLGDRSSTLGHQLSFCHLKRWWNRVHCNPKKHKLS